MLLFVAVSQVLVVSDPKKSGSRTSEWCEGTPPNPNTKVVPQPDVPAIETDDVNSHGWRPAEDVIWTGHRQSVRTLSERLLRRMFEHEPAIRFSGAQHRRL